MTSFAAELGLVQAFLGTIGRLGSEEAAMMISSFNSIIGLPSGGIPDFLVLEEPFIKFIGAARRLTALVAGVSAQPVLTRVAVPKGSDVALLLRSEETTSLVLRPDPKTAHPPIALNFIPEDLSLKGPLMIVAGPVEVPRLAYYRVGDLKVARDNRELREKRAPALWRDGVAVVPISEGGGWVVESRVLLGALALRHGLQYLLGYEAEEAPRPLGEVVEIEEAIRDAEDRPLLMAEEEVNLTDVQDVGLYLARKAARMDDEIERAFSLESPQLFLSDEELGKMETILTLLISNALSSFVEKDPPRGRVIVTLTRREGEFTLEVSDNGTGIPPDLLPLFFEERFTTKDGRSAALGGSGNGTMIVREQAELLRFKRIGVETKFGAEPARLKVITPFGAYLVDAEDRETAGTTIRVVFPFPLFQAARFGGG